jgi:hypothetical protein
MWAHAPEQRAEKHYIEDIAAVADFGQEGGASFAEGVAVFHTALQIEENHFPVALQHIPEVVDIDSFFATN